MRARHDIEPAHPAGERTDRFTQFKTRNAVIEIFLDLKRAGTTITFSTHDEQTLLKTADRSLRFESGLFHEIAYAMERTIKIRWHHLLPFAIFPLVLPGCNSAPKDGRPKVLRYAYSPEAEQLEAGGLRKDLMRNYLEKQLHMPVEVVEVEGYASTIEAMRANKIDLATFGALAYILASQKGIAEAIAAKGFPNGRIGGYRSAIAVPKDSAIHSMQNMKEHAKNIVFAFSDPASTSGDLYPRAGLINLGINPEQDFKKVLFAGTHLETVMAIKAGNVDAGAFQSSAATRLQARGKLASDDLHVLWISDLIPNACYAVRKQLPEQLKKDIQTAIVAIPQKDPELWANMMRLRGNTNPAEGGTQLIVVNDSSYNEMREYAMKVKDFSLVEK
ncbi:phosphate/phosphite/phosphonate ABC transporter substrate-binding protein [Granulicella sp. L60]|uniref:phosphate/phosphite/phosphonate ABC transporter substrate-binding protein n=1 Tax=Granulicella sp. L60 TaxID=1641866 RepID=UPI00131BD4B5|nr:phosphate/phosphite/phosphonate ABC transporter substrate-binding protein [Granulicella sp. L60]